MNNTEITNNEISNDEITNNKITNNEIINDENKIDDKTLNVDNVQIVDKNITLAEFKEYVEYFIKLDDSIKLKQQEITKLKEQKKPYETFILEYLEKVGENIIEMKGCKLRKNKSETKAPLGLDIIKDTIGEEYKDKLKVDKILEKMNNRRPITSRTYLKRTVEKS
jgi:hypothetical protein